MPKRKKLEGWWLRLNVSKIAQDEILRRFLPSPFSPLTDVSNLVIRRLSKIPIFKKEGNDFYIRDPEKTVRFQTARIELEGALFSELAFTIISHYKNIQLDSEIFSPKRIEAFLEALGELCSWKKELISSGAFNEKSFKRTINRFGFGMVKCTAGFSPDQRNKLVKDLEACFNKFVPKLRTKKNAKFHCIAYILKGLDLEEGTEEEIFGRIKVNYYRKI